MDINKKFFSQLNGKAGYRIYEYPGYEGIKYGQGDSAMVDMHYYDPQTKRDVLFKEKIYLVRAKIVYTDDNKSMSVENTEIEFDHAGNRYLFTAYANRYTQIYQVVGVRSVLDKK
jgi:hypothetical protein